MTEEVSWIPVGALAHAFAPDSYAPQATSDLVGRTHSLHLEGGGVVEYRFLDHERLLCGISGVRGRSRLVVESDAPSAGAPTNAGASSVADAPVPSRYFAARLRNGLYFVDHVRADEPAASLSSVLDLERGVATVVEGRLPGERESRRSLAERIDAGEELTAVSALFVSASVDRPFTEDTPRHLPTQDMLGGRVEYTYSPTEQYEHIYLNERFYTWHCLQGSEKGLADTDRCHYYGIDDSLYLFAWREKIVPTLGVVVVDFAALRTVGKIFGYENVAEVGSSSGEPAENEASDPGSVAKGLSNFPVGARARVIDVPRQVEIG